MKADWTDGQGDVTYVPCVPAMSGLLPGGGDGTLFRIAGRGALNQRSARLDR
jgi:hypothetical protein